MDALITQGDIKFVFVGGKGGVGKTTNSSAIATQFAKSGKRVLLLSTDPAHSLSDAFRLEFSGVPTKVTENLHVMEIDPSESMQAELGSWAAIAKEFEGVSGKVEGEDGEKKEEDLGEKIKSFQEWL